MNCESLYKKKGGKCTKKPATMRLFKYKQIVGSGLMAKPRGMDTEQQVNHYWAQLFSLRNEEDVCSVLYGADQNGPVLKDIRYCANIDALYSILSEKDAKRD